MLIANETLRPSPFEVSEELFFGCQIIISRDHISSYILFVGTKISQRHRNSLGLCFLPQPAGHKRQ